MFRSYSTKEEYKTSPKLRNPNPVTYGDPFINNVVLLLNGEGTNGSTDITDSSLNEKTVTVFGDAQISTVQKKYGVSSILFDGTTDYLRFAPTADLHLGTGDFTIEGWFRFDVLTTQFLYGNYVGSGSTASIALHLSNSTTIVFRFGDATLLSYTVPTLSTNTFYHIACTRASGSIRVFVDGTESSTGSQTGTGNINNDHPYQLSGFNFSTSSGSYIDGYVDAFRVTAGIARYTTDFDAELDTYLNV